MSTVSYVTSSSVMGALVPRRGCRLANTPLSLPIKCVTLLRDALEQNISFPGLISEAFC